MDKLTSSLELSTARVVKIKVFGPSGAFIEVFTQFDKRGSGAWEKAEMRMPSSGYIDVAHALELGQMIGLAVTICGQLDLELGGEEISFEQEKVIKRIATNL